jgi:hypothetical protein
MLITEQNGIYVTVPVSVGHPTATTSVNLQETFFCLYKLEQAEKAEKAKKCQSDLFFPKKLISGYLLKAKKPKKVLKSYQKL